MIVVFPWQRSTKQFDAFLCTIQTFGGDVWQEAEATLQVEQTWDLLADASAVAQAELSQLTMSHVLERSPALVTIYCLGGFVVKGNVVSVGEDVVVLRCSNSEIIALNSSAIVRVTGLSTALLEVQVSDHPMHSLTLRRWLRDLIGQRIECTTTDGWMMRGQLKSVGQDMLQMNDFEGESSVLAMQAIVAIRSSIPTQQ
jgi:hypothetical protein